MGRLIDADYIDERIEDELGIGADRQLWYEEIINDAPTVDAIPKAEYENRLKADLVAMLTEIQLEIEELNLTDSEPKYQQGTEEAREYIANLLEEKIDKLKG